MNTDLSASICIPAALLKSAPAQVRAWVLKSAGFDAIADSSTENSDLGLARLSDAQARRFLVPPMKDTTRAVIQALAELTPRCRWADLMDKLGQPIDDAGPYVHAWTGLTKRTRTVTGDPEAVLLAFPNWESVDCDTAEILMDGQTHAAFRRVLEIA
jgi:hypothetical protein